MARRRVRGHFYRIPDVNSAKKWRGCGEFARAVGTLCLPSHWLRVSSPKRPVRNHLWPRVGLAIEMTQTSVVDSQPLGIFYWPPERKGYCLCLCWQKNWMEETAVWILKLVILKIMSSIFVNWIKIGRRVSWIGNSAVVISWPFHVNHDWCDIGGNDGTAEAKKLLYHFW